VEQSKLAEENGGKEGSGGTCSFLWFLLLYFPFFFFPFEKKIHKKVGDTNVGIISQMGFEVAFEIFKSGLIVME
jgi:hypothetical protein